MLQTLITGQGGLSLDNFRAELPEFVKLIINFAFVLKAASIAL